MPTLLIILTPLLVPLAGFFLYGRISGRPDITRLGGVVGLSLAFLVFASGHFLVDDKLVLLLPEWLPGRMWIVWVTGVMEGLVALALLYPGTRARAGWAAIVLLVAFFPGNVYGAIQQVDFGGHADGPVYLLLRGPLQLLLIWWAWFFVLRRR